MAIVVVGEGEKKEGSRSGTETDSQSHGPEALMRLWPAYVIKNRGELRAAVFMPSKKRSPSLHIQSLSLIWR